jgi:prevent-host-death family protein
MAKESRIVAAGDFKNRCLRLMDEVSRDGVPITVTKRGKPLVRIVPVRDTTTTRSLRGTIVHEDEEIYSTGEDFDADS